MLILIFFHFSPFLSLHNVDLDPVAAASQPEKEDSKKITYERRRNSASVSPESKSTEEESSHPSPQSNGQMPNDSVV